MQIFEMHKHDVEREADAREVGETLIQGSSMPCLPSTLAPLTVDEEVDLILECFRFFARRSIHPDDFIQFFPPFCAATEGEHLRAAHREISERYGLGFECSIAITELEGDRPILPAWRKEIRDYLVYQSSRISNFLLRIELNRG